MRGTYGGLKIARMDLLFDNAKMIDLLLKRGKAVKKKENDQIIELEAEIHSQIKDQYNTPIVGVFITFEKDEDVFDALNAMDRKVQIFGKEITMDNTIEPSNYNWENMGFNTLRRTIGFILSLSVMLLLIFIAYNMQFKMEKSVSQYDNYETFDCAVFHNSFDPSFEQHHNRYQVIIPNYSEERY